eukprot:gb/GEZN01000221.1/.p1 GENE.gb/GEZN01000221.1/~~gb/GEZN01000221.1/.p1  ORF type:complete len:1802 (+),score=284.99 gb/GEZN01000221.1/:73-5478(+)
MPKKSQRKKKISKSPILLSLASQSPEDHAKLLLESAKSGNFEHVQQILDSGKVQVKAIDDAYLLAAECGHIKAVAQLANKVSSVICTTSSRGETALSLAARNGHEMVVLSLLKIGHKLECKNASGATPLYTSLEANQEGIFNLLLDRKANVNVMDTSRNSILHVASRQGLASMVSKILLAGAATNILNDKEETPLEVAKNAEICRLILEFHTSAQFPPPISSKTPGTATSPFRELPSGPASYLFWTAMGVGKDSYMFQNFGVYPFDRLNDTERIIVLTEVAEAMSGYKMDLKCNILNESALYAVFALMKARIKKELEEVDKDDDLESSYLWRKRVLEAYEQIYNTNASLAGLSIECWQKSVWNTVVNLLARSLFGESFWEKKHMFLSPNALERMVLLKNFQTADGYFSAKLPSTASIEIQLTFKKLITMSKTFLCDEPVRPSGCFCQDCIAELEVPLTFKLQFLEEAAEEKRKIKKGRKIKDRRDQVKDQANRRKLDELVLSHRKELKSFWSSITIEEKWCLTEITTTELSECISQSPRWETLRAALDSYAKYAWEEDVLEITEDCVTIADDMCEEKGMHDMLEATLDAVELNSIEQAPPSSGMTEDEWDKRGRQMLENLVLAEFACKIAAQYVLKKQESRAQQVALELEQEEEQQVRAAEKKAKAKKKRKKKKKGGSANDEAEGSDDVDDPASVENEEVCALRISHSQVGPGPATVQASSRAGCSSAMDNGPAVSAARARGVSSTKIPAQNSFSISSYRLANSIETDSPDTGKTIETFPKSINSSHSSTNTTFVANTRGALPVARATKSHDPHGNVASVEQGESKSARKRKKKKKRKAAEEAAADPSKLADTSSGHTDRPPTKCTAAARRLPESPRAVQEETQSGSASPASKEEQPEAADTAESPLLSEPDSEEEEETKEEGNEQRSRGKGGKQGRWAAANPFAMLNEDEEEDEEDGGDALPSPGSDVEDVLDEDSQIEYSEEEVNVGEVEAIKPSSVPSKPISPPKSVPGPVQSQQATANNATRKASANPPPSSVHSAGSVPSSKTSWTVTSVPSTQSPPPPRKPVTATAASQGAGGGANWWDHYQDGMMFICTKETFKECMELKLLGLPRQHLRVVRSLKAKTSALFLFNVGERQVYGVFEATSNGQENMVPGAWARNKAYSRSSPFPAQISFRVVNMYEPLAESNFRNLFADGNRIRKLDGKQVKDLIQVFRARAKPVGRPAVQRRPVIAASPVVAKEKPIVAVPRTIVAPTVAPVHGGPRKPVKNVWKMRAEAAAASAKATHPDQTVVDSSQSERVEPASIVAPCDVETVDPEEPVGSSIQPQHPEQYSSDERVTVSGSSPQEADESNPLDAMIGHPSFCLADAAGKSNILDTIQSYAMASEEYAYMAALNEHNEDSDEQQENGIVQQTDAYSLPIKGSVMYSEPVARMQPTIFPPSTVHGAPPPGFSVNERALQTVSSDRPPPSTINHPVPSRSYHAAHSHLPIQSQTQTNAIDSTRRLEGSVGTITQMAMTGAADQEQEPERWQGRGDSREGADTLEARANPLFWNFGEHQSGIWHHAQQQQLHNLHNHAITDVNLEDPVSSVQARASRDIWGFEAPGVGSGGWESAQQGQMQLQETEVVPTALQEQSNDLDGGSLSGYSVGHPNSDSVWAQAQPPIEVDRSSASGFSSLPSFSLPYGGNIWGGGGCGPVAGAPASSSEGVWGGSNINADQAPSGHRSGTLGDSQRGGLLGSSALPALAPLPGSGADGIWGPAVNVAPFFASALGPPSGAADSGASTQDQIQNGQSRKTTAGIW